MSWLSKSPLRASLGKRRTSISPPKECDPTACFDSFRKHWQQTYEIIERTLPPVGYPIQDDVLGVVNHLDQMVTLLLLELRSAGNSLACESQQWPCLEHLLSENLLDRLFAWSIHTGKFSNVLRLEQLKLYELLVSHSRHQLLVHEPFLRPLMRLLGSCVGECFPVEVEKRLVVLLNQLCVSLMQNIELLDLFFYASSDHGISKFVIFTLLIPFVHREGGIGQQARDALLLCMSLSKKNENVGLYIAEHSNVCPVLATGLSGLYSVLPRKLVIEADDWHRLTPDDVNDLREITMFMNSLEFCNAVVQVAHPLVRDQMLEFLYGGFLVPVMGPALLQDSLGFSLERLDSPQEASTVEELVSATAYLDLFIRSITDPGLLYSFVRFLLEDKYDGERILDCLVNRVNSRTRLCLVSLALLDTLLSLHCEDVLLELVLRHLVPCAHVMVSQRRRVRDVEPYCRSSDRFLCLAPACCSPQAPPIGIAPSPSLPAMMPHALPPYGLRPSESLYGNYHAYLVDARGRIRSTAQACKGWTYPYDGENPPHGPRTPGEEAESGYQSFVPRHGSSQDGSASSGSREGSAERLTGLRRRMSQNMDNCGAAPVIGPFLDVLLRKLEAMMTNGLYVNLQLTGLISRLAVHPQPLLHSFLLNHSLVFQPSIRSLFQVLGSLKFKLDQYLSRQPHIDDLVCAARDILVAREDRLVNARRHALEVSLPPSAPSSRRSSIASNDSNFSRGESKRRSLSSTITSVFRRAAQVNTTNPIRENSLESLPDTGYRYVNRVMWPAANTEVHNYVMCAVILDEWLKELAAITQEQALAALDK